MKVGWIFTDIIVYLFIILLLITKGEGILSILGVVALIIIISDKIRMQIEETIQEIKKSKMEQQGK